MDYDLDNGQILYQEEISFDEDSSIIINIEASDIDGDEITYSITEGIDITAILDGNQVTFSAPSDFNGSEGFTVSVSDGTLVASTSFTVTVTAQNDAPVANAGVAETNEDQSVVISLTASDTDDNILAYSLSTEASNGSVFIEGSLATYTPDENFYGSDSFTF